MFELLLLSCTAIALVAWFGSNNGAKPAVLLIRATVRGRRAQPDAHLAKQTQMAETPRRPFPPLPFGLGQSSSQKMPSRARRLARRNDPFRDHRAEVGPRAEISTRWWQRARALILLAVVVLVLGMALAAFIGLVAFAGTLLIEILAS